MRQQTQNGGDASDPEGASKVASPKVKEVDMLSQTVYPAVWGKSNAGEESAAVNKDPRIGGFKYLGSTSKRGASEALKG